MHAAILNLAGVRRCGVVDRKQIAIDGQSATQSFISDPGASDQATGLRSLRSQLMTESHLRESPAVDEFRRGNENNDQGITEADPCRRYSAS